MKPDDLSHTVADYLGRFHDPFNLNSILAHELTNGRCKIKLVSDLIVDLDLDLKDGIPAVGHVFTQDNDFWNMQRQEWKDAYPELCTDAHTLLITEVIGSKVLNDTTIRLSKRKLIVEILG